MDINKIKMLFNKLYYYALAKIIYAKKYNEKYIQGKWFSGRYGGLFAEGWKWVVQDYRNCKRQGRNINALWPVSSQSIVINPQNIKFDVEDLNNFQNIGNYYQAIATISIGKGTYIASNVGIITANHSIHNLNEHDAGKPINLGNKCWIGMNSVILPGVNLGDMTIVGAGSVVTKSFPEGHCVIAGNPAAMIRNHEYY